MAFNGAEPVHAETLDRFAAAFAECGFRREAFFPCYGLAEATLIVSGGPRWRRPVVKKVVAEALGRHQVVAATGEDNGAKEIVSCGRNLADERMAARFGVLLEAFAADPSQKIVQAAMLPRGEERQLLVEWNDTRREVARDLRIHQIFARQAARAPDACAIVWADERLSYGELDRRANQSARRLRTLGVMPEIGVGVYLERTPEMIIGLLGILKAGGYYAPIDPTLPVERRDFILKDARVAVLLSQSHLAPHIVGPSVKVVCLDTDWPEIASQSAQPPADAITAANLCYVIYTSGSTGRPKGVMVSHDNVVNFFAGMDEKVGCAPGDATLAVTGLSFDISVLELLWTLASGGQVILVEEATVVAQGRRGRSARLERAPDFSLFYFASDDSLLSAEGYRLLLEGAKFADRHGFHAVWTPERHFHPFGGLYPNPAVTSAALATLTERVQIRAGSVVLPLHHPLRVAEEWALVDNLSKGRAGVAFASGWHADDFVFFPDHYPARKEIMLEGIETVRRLWRGEAMKARGGGGSELEVQIYPKPVQPELPIWLTAAGSPDTFVKAGELGFNVLTHLLGQTLDEVAEKISLYRAARARHDHDPATGKVTLMLHTFLGESREAVRALVRQPFTNYLKSSIGLIANLAKSLNLSLNLNAMSPQDKNDLLAYAFDRYFETGALFGAPETCQAMVEQVRAIGVDEIACLIDFGVDTTAALDGLRRLAVLKERCSARRGAEDYSLAAQARRHNATLMQCTPSLMGLLSHDSAVMDSLAGLRSLLLGGEALPPQLAHLLKSALPARLLNMYGPTETTIWSATYEVGAAGATAPIGQPIANTQFYVFDRNWQIAPLGAEGELLIGGDGVARGYLNRPELTAERFIPDPYSGRRGRRLYKTGDLTRFTAEGDSEFLGRLDYQVKIRGFRVELGEIEAAIGQRPEVSEAVVVAREDAPGDKRLVAYVAPKPAESLSINRLRQHLKERLPDYMIPSYFVTLERLPQTANGKVNRKALPAPDSARVASEAGSAAPRNQLEQAIADIWRRALKVEHVGIHDNFFDLGGHSLLLTQVHERLRELLKRDLPLIKVLEHPTINSLARISHWSEQKILLVVISLLCPET